MKKVGNDILVLVHSCCDMVTAIDYRKDNRKTIIDNYCLYILLYLSGKQSQEQQKDIA